MNLPHWRLLLFSSVTSFLACFCVGYNLTVLNVPIQFFQQFINSSQHAHYHYYFHDTQLDSIYSFTVAILNIGGFIGSFLVILVVNRFGRRISHFVICALTSAIGSALQSSGIAANYYELIIIGRFISGASSGLVTGVLPIYLTESSPVKYRGFVANMESIFISVAALIGVITSLEKVLGRQSTLGYLIGIPIIPAALLLLLTPFFPESPKYLYLNKQDEAGALRSLQFYHGDQVSPKDIFDEYDEERENAVESLGVVAVLKDPDLRRPTLLGVLGMLAAMATGILAIFTYSKTIFEDAGVDASFVGYLSVIMSSCNTAGAIAAGPLLDRFGRRPLMLYGLIGTTVLNTIFMIAHEVSHAYDIKGLSYLGCVMVIIHVTVYNLGPGPVVWFFAAEITPQSARSVASSLTVATNWITSMIIIQIFLVLDKKIHAYSFIILFIVPSIFFTVILWIYLPESKNRTPEEIAATWKKNPPGTTSPGLHEAVEMSYGVLREQGDIATRANPRYGINDKY